MDSHIKIKEYIDTDFPKLGVNKKREIARLLYEISKRDNVPFEKIIEDIEADPLTFLSLKKELLSRRFPETSVVSPKMEPYLPDLSFDEKNTINIESKKELDPKNIYFEKEVASSDMVRRFKNAFPGASFKEITSLKDYIKSNDFDITTYNNRRNNFFITKENYDFFKKCPCTTGCVCCNYHIFNFGFGCPYECTYCYLQEYSNSPGIIVPANIESYLNIFKEYADKPIRIGTGEFTDSLALDHVTGFSKQIVAFLKDFPEIVFEFKTKSNNIDNIITAEPLPNVVISWSLNPQSFIDKNEFYSTSLAERINAAKKCVAAGYNVGFHFDPVVYYAGWDKEYKEVIDKIFDNIDGKHVKWISIGTFRFPRNLKKVIENRFPDNTILDGELIIGFDGKLRYAESIRLNIYKNMIKWISDRTEDTFVYLCMEKKNIWKECGLSNQWRWN
jgi:spore photoproduct lyase